MIHEKTTAPSDNAPSPPAWAESPLYAAMEQALFLRHQYGATQSDIEYLLNGWRWRHGIPAREHELKIAAYGAVLEYPPRTLSKIEARGIVTAAFEAVNGDVERGVEMIRTWCCNRGLVPPTQVARLCDALRAKCAAAPPMAAAA